MGVTFKWNKPLGRVAEEAIGGDKTALFMASEARRLMNPYVPRGDTGMLADNVDTYAEGGKGVIHYRSPYAHYQYEGQMMVAPNGSAWAKSGEIKHYNGVALTHSKESPPKATAHWDKAMMKERKQDLVKAVQAFIKK